MWIEARTERVVPVVVVVIVVFNEERTSGESFSDPARRGIIWFVVS